MKVLILNESLQVFGHTQYYWWKLINKFCFRLPILLILTTFVLAFKKNLPDRRYLDETLEEANIENFDCLQWMGSSLHWCSNDYSMTSGYWSKDPFYSNLCSTNYSQISMEAQYLACPNESSQCGVQNIDMKHGIDRYVVDLSSLPNETVWKYTFSIDSTSSESIKVDIGKFSKISLETSKAHTWTLYSYKVKFSPKKILTLQLLRV